MVDTFFFVVETTISKHLESIFVCMPLKCIYISLHSQETFSQGSAKWNLTIFSVIGLVTQTFVQKITKGRALV